MDSGDVKIKVRGDQPQQKQMALDLEQWRAAACLWEWRHQNAGAWDFLGQKESFGIEDSISRFIFCTYKLINSKGGCYLYVDFIVRSFPAHEF